MISPVGWLFDVLGIKTVVDGQNTVYPQRTAVRFIGARVSDNPALGVTDVDMGLDSPLADFAYFPSLSSVPYSPGTGGAIYVTEPPIGLYRVSYYLCILVAGTAGTINVGVQCKDDHGYPVSQFSGTVPVNSTQSLSGQFVCEVGVLSNISFFVLGAGVIPAALNYTLRVAVERIQ